MKHFKHFMIGIVFLTVFLTACSMGGDKEIHQKEELMKPEELSNTFLNGDYSLDLNVWEFNEKAISFYESVSMENLSSKMTLRL